MEENKTKEPKMYTEAEVTEIVNNSNKAAAQQVSRLLSQIQQMDMSNALHRLEFLLKIIKIGIPSFTSDFIVKCAEEVEEMMYPHTENSQEENE